MSDTTSVPTVHVRPPWWHRLPVIQQLRQSVGLQRGMLVAGLVITGIFVVVAIFAPLLAPYGFNQLRGPDGLFGAQQPPSADHLLGTTVGGYDVVQNAAAVRRVLAPVIADERSLYWRLSAQENLELYGALQGLDGTAARTRAAELLRVVGLDDAGGKIVAAFSSGMKQRLLIARALIARPKVLLLDEPTRSLDPLSARALRAFLREEIVQRQGCTVLLATHNAEEALELCTRVGVLDRGRLLAAGTAEELSREIGDERYRLWTRAPAHPGIAALAERGIVRDVAVQSTDEPGWVRVEMEIPGGLDRASQVTAFLVEQGVVVARLERAALSLAELIERVVAHAGAQEGDDA